MFSLTPSPWCVYTKVIGFYVVNIGSSHCHILPPNSYHERAARGPSARRLGLPARNRVAAAHAGRAPASHQAAPGHGARVARRALLPAENGDQAAARAGVSHWTSFQKASHDVDGLEVSRIGSTAHTVKIKLLAAQTPERFSISSELEAAIGQYLGPAKAYTKQDIVLAMWEYIKLRNLIKEDDCRVVVCDDRLVQVLNCVSLPFTSIVVALKQHLTPINAIDLEYTLSLSTACESELLDEKFFDVSVAATSDLDRTRARALKECEELQQDQKKELALLQAQEVDILDRLQTYTRKKEWMAQFAQDPCGFMADVKKSQVADEQILAAETELDEFNVSHPQQFTQPWQEKKDRAKELREQRQRGVFSDEHTFAPKVNPRARNPSPPASREEPDQASRSLSSDSMAYRNYGHNNNHQDTEDPTSYGNDALDNLSRRYPKKAPPTPQQMASLNVTPLEPEHDTLFREVKRATGREIEDLPIKKTLAPPRSGNHIGPCLRNSSCGCPKCAGGSLGPATTSNVHAVEAPIRRREQRAVPSTDPYRENNGRAMAAPNEMGVRASSTFITLLSHFPCGSPLLSGYAEFTDAPQV
ncbi:hypothetical protein ON010_g16093 [Phytophthora cinnamomi]|nr:hypothetical protein ON010_g16093 [Phytophthora cinnamomi]